MLQKNFYRRDARLVARELLGKLLVFHKDSAVFSGYITETEAYLGTEDRASKAYKGIKTKGNWPMFLDGGHSFIYLTYGIHYLLNFVTGFSEDPQGVLIRGIFLVEGREAAAKNRYGKMPGALTEKQWKNLSNGPGKLTQALGVTKKENALKITKPPLYVVDKGCSPEILSSKRIGIDYAEEAKEYPWRYVIGRDDRI